MVDKNMMFFWLLQSTGFPEICSNGYEMVLRILYGAAERIGVFEKVSNIRVFIPIEKCHFLLQ